MLKVISLEKSYGHLKVLKGLNLEVKKGSIYGFLGKNGAGKTTTLNILTGLLKYDSGEILFDGIEFKNGKREIQKRIGYTPQSPVFYGYMNSCEYLKFIGELSGMSSKDINLRALEILELVGLKEDGKRKIGGYSGGMKQRLGIAVALFNKPEMVFFDEPTSALDPEGRMEVLKLIKKLKEDNITVFFSTHILNDVERICDEVSIIDEGKIVLEEEIHSLQKHYTQPIYDIEVENTEIKGINKLQALSYIQNIKIKDSIVSIYVKDLEVAKRELIKDLISLDITPINYNLRKSNLEDIFTRLVSKNENL